MKTWTQRVEAYVDELAETRGEIDEILDETRLGTKNLQVGTVDASTAALAEAITRLETLVGRREELLREEDAPAAGLSLTEKLQGTRHIDDARLARRCGQVGEELAATHNRAVALFVCQYHLSQFHQELIDRLGGASGPKTYSPSGQTATTGRSGGGLFNEAA